MVFILQGCVVDKYSGQKSPDQRQPVPLLTKYAERHSGELSPNSYIDLFLKNWATSLRITEQHASSFYLLAVLGWPGGTLPRAGQPKGKSYTCKIPILPPRFSCRINTALDDKGNGHMIEYVAYQFFLQ